MDKELFLRVYSLTKKDHNRIKQMKRELGMTDDEIARRFQITPPDVRRILHPPKNYGKYTAEEKFRHWQAGLKRAQTVKNQRDGK